MLAGGIIIFLVGAGLFWLSKKQQKTSQTMARAKSVPIDQLQANTQAEIQGTITANQPLQTPFSKRDCVYYEYEVERETRKRDQEGRLHTEWETVSEDKRSVPFMVKDQTGSVAVNPEGATIETEDLGEQLIRRGDIYDNEFLRDVVNAFSETPMRVQEKALLANNPAYIFGYVTEGSEGLEFKNNGKDFVISHRSEEEVEKSTARSATTMKVLGIIGLVAGVILAIYSFF